MPKGLADIHLSCECGSTLRLYSIRPEEILEVESLWGLYHDGHEEVTADEASQIRRASRWDATNAGRSRAVPCAVCGENCRQDGRHTNGHRGQKHRAVPTCP